MKKLNSRIGLLLGIILAFLLFSCNEEDDEVTVAEDPETEEEAEEPEDISINQWILENMELYYLWNDEIPDEPDMSPTPDAFFESLLYTYDEVLNPEGDRFSFISDDAEALTASFSGETKSTGMQYRLFYRSSTGDEIAAQVIYTLDGSPANLSGLERGDIFTRVNGAVLDVDNYLSLLNDFDVMTLTMAVVENSAIVELEETVQLTKVTLQENPIYLDSIYEISGQKVGYLVYHQFIPGPNDSQNEDYDRHIDDIFSGFKSAGVTELIIDLRYNPGGYASSAVNMASLIGTGVTSNEVFYQEEYNESLQRELELFYGEDYFYQMFYDRNENIGGQIDRVYFLVSYYTASSSELVINGLKPYMDVFLIGEQTYGKNVGSFTITDDSNEENNWALQPIVMKAYNGLGQSDYTAGFAPDMEVVEPLELVPFGQVTDPLLGQALALISGSGETARRSSENIPAIIGSSIQRKAVTLKHFQGEELWSPLAP